jgi:hypothetical protein
LRGFGLWTVEERATGKFIAAALRHSRTELARTDVISVIRVGNRGSVGVATKLGAVLGGSVDFYGGKAEIRRYPCQ